MPPSTRGILRHVPNTLTALRLLIAAAFPWSAEGARPVLLVAALATEYLDGAISRRFQVQSRLGRLLDPVADKLLFAAVALTFLSEERLALRELLLLAVRDIGVLLALAWMAARRDWKRLADLGPDLAGKATTVLQYAALFGPVFGAEPHPAVVGLTAATGLLAVAHYFHRLRREIPERPGAR